MSKTQRVKSRKPEWRKVVAKYENPSLPRSVGQLANTIIPYFALVVVMYFSLDVSYWITLALAFPAAGFLVRAFIICHDCGHGSFFASRRANGILGACTGFLTLVPYYYWRHQHARHHASAGDLGKRGSGDIWTLTVQEYVNLPRRSQLWYRVYRNPLVLFGIGPAYTFFVRYRCWRRSESARARWSTIKTNAALVGVILVASLTIGIKAYLMILLPIMLISSTRVCGCSTYSISLRAHIGNATPIGVTWSRHCKGRLSTSCLVSCNGSAATSGFITFII